MAVCVLLCLVPAVYSFINPLLNDTTFVWIHMLVSLYAPVKNAQGEFPLLIEQVRGLNCIVQAIYRNMVRTQVDMSHTRSISASKHCKNYLCTLYVSSLGEVLIHKCLS